MSKNHIQIDPNSGKPCVVGTGIRVWDIYVQSERLGKTPDEIIAAYPHLTLANVHAALAYYWDNQQEIETQMKQADEFFEQLKKRQRTRTSGKETSCTIFG